jgi:2-oxoisovalerate dehydrogenase E1 component beta subunit
MPSTPYDAKGLLIAAIQDDDPVVFLEPKRLYRAATGEVPEEPYTVTLGKAKVVRSGRDLTVLTYGAMVPVVLQSVEEAEAENGLSIEVIDLRTLMPFDIETILQSVEKTGRALVVHEAPRTCGFGAEIASTINEKAMLHLQAPVYRVTGFDTPFPYTLEHDYLPDRSRILAATRRSLEF